MKPSQYEVTLKICERWTMTMYMQSSMYVIMAKEKLLYNELLMTDFMHENNFK